MNLSELSNSKHRKKRYISVTSFCFFRLLVFISRSFKSENLHIALINLGIFTDLLLNSRSIAEIKLNVRCLCKHDQIFSDIQLSDKDSSFQITCTQSYLTVSISLLQQRKTRSSERNAEHI